MRIPSILNLLLLLFLSSVGSLAQVQEEVLPPYHIKTVTFVQNGQNAIPVFGLHDPFEIQFDDLYGNEADYYFQIVHCDYDWRPSQLSKAEYLAGFDEQRIQEYTNSFNTLQLYSHYRLAFPNKFMRFRVSGNYIIRILNNDRQLLFSRKFVLYENLVTVPMQIKRSRDLKTIDYKHNVEFSIKSPNIQFQSPLQNVRVMLMQNGQFQTALRNIKPQYTIGNDLIYKYNEETQFWAGNEFHYFENKDIRAANNFIARVDASEIYNAHLYRNEARASQPYTFAPDINGNFIVNNINSEQSWVEADYAWVFFSLSAPSYFGKNPIYVTGMFNNHATIPEYQLEYNKEKGVYEKAILIKQGFTNYRYTIADGQGKIDQSNAIDGNFYQTENDYLVIVYYRENGQRYDRVIGRGSASSLDISN